MSFAMRRLARFRYASCRKRRLCTCMFEMTEPDSTSRRLDSGPRRESAWGFWAWRSAYLCSGAKWFAIHGQGMGLKCMPGSHLRADPGTSKTQILKFDEENT